MQPRFKAPIKGATATGSADRRPTSLVSPPSSSGSCQLAVVEKAPSAAAGKHFSPFQHMYIEKRCIYTIFFFDIQLLVRFESMWLFPIHVLFLVISIFVCVLLRRNLPEMRQTQLWELPSKMRDEKEYIACVP